MSAKRKKQRHFKKHRTKSRNRSQPARQAADASAKPKETGAPRDWYPYRQLKSTETHRRREIEAIFKDEFAFIDDCLALAARQVEVLGDLRPAGIRDVANDLSCDAFEFLYEARKAIAENRPSIVFPAMRRAFESISLCHLFTVKPEYSESWSSGRRLNNADVRQQLEDAPLSESVEELRTLYRHFSQGTHPNRSHIPFLFLGEGNKFTLGAIPPVDLLILRSHLLHLMSLCYWYAGIFLYFYGESIIPKLSAKFKQAVLDLTPRSQELQTSLRKELKALPKADGDEIARGIGPDYLNQSS